MTVMEAQQCIIIHLAEKRVVGKLRSLLSEHRHDFGRCDVCCVDATCPHQDAAQNLDDGLPHSLCPADARFDAIQDMRNQLWSRAAAMLDAVESQHEHQATQIQRKFNVKSQWKSSQTRCGYTLLAHDFIDSVAKP